MPRETLRRREQKAAAFAVRSGTATRRLLDPSEAKALFFAIDIKDTAGFGIRKLSTLDLDGLHEAPPCITWEPRITLIAYAAWRRRDHFVHGLLRAGADPGVRWASRLAPRGAAPGSAPAALIPGGRLREHLLSLRTQLAVWVVRTLVLLRHAGARRAARTQSVDAPADAAAAAQRHCTCEECGVDEAYQPLAWEPCGHCYCEPCFWAYALEAPGDAASTELRCPACGARPPAAPGNAGAARGGEGTALAAERPGADWDCSNCGYSNFMRRCDCRNCGHRWKVPDSEESVDTVAAVAEATPSIVEVVLPPAKQKEASLQRWLALPADKGSEPATGKCFQKFRALDPEAAAAYWLGDSRSERTHELLKAGGAGEVRRLAALVEAGVDLDAENEYGQTVLFLAACHGHEAAVRLLLAAGANAEHRAHGGSTAAVAAAAVGHEHVLRALRDASADMNCAGSEGLTATQYIERPPTAGSVTGVLSSDAQVRALISTDCDHPGAGSCYLDGVCEERFLCQLDELFRCLPIAEKTKECSNDRSYFCDAEGWLRRGLEQALARGRALPGDGSVPVDSAMAHMRFLQYTLVGGGLPPHVDLARTDSSGQRSTHTFILYLTDCDSGGETVLLERIPEQGEVGAPASTEAVLASVTPRRGRLLVFPHMCPHLARPVVEVPKVLLRGEMYRRR
mmetsp:Transcript_663/g.1184  ORF Transcript_663/g.1184 Transcript_663/m.1184 type:complete len:682 (+) Transcript_663:44-2089(+)